MMKKSVFSLLVTGCYLAAAVAWGGKDAEGGP